MKTSAQWRKELRRRLQLVSKADRSAIAAVFRQLVIDIMSEDQSAPKKIIVGGHVIETFKSTEEKTAFIQEMAVDKVWADDRCMKAFAVAFDLNIAVTVQDGHISSKPLITYDLHISTKKDELVFQVVNFSNAHWSAAVKNERTQLLDVIATPSDGNCGLHTLSDVWQLHEHEAVLTDEQLINTQIAEARHEDADIAQRKEQLMTACHDVSFDSLKKIAVQLATQSDDLGEFVKGHLDRITELEQLGVDQQELYDDLCDRLIARASVDQEATDLLNAKLSYNRLVWVGGSTLFASSCSREASVVPSPSSFTC